MKREYDKLVADVLPTANMKSQQRTYLNILYNSPVKEYYHTAVAYLYSAYANNSGEDNCVGITNFARKFTLEHVSQASLPTFSS